MKTNLKKIGLRRVYDVSQNQRGGVSLQLSDRIVDLGEDEFRYYLKLMECGGSMKESEEYSSKKILCEFEQAGLLYGFEKIPQSLSGEVFHRDYFSKILPSWLSEAFSHPFWERMTGGRGSYQLFSGWMIELYHYTLNANRHMPLSVAYTREKPLKSLRAKHYAEEWNHYSYFMKSLKALGYSESEIKNSVPLPMTLALSNFMRQAARTDILCYSICSAVLEGTTTDRGAFNPYYEKCTVLYGVPKVAVMPIYAHLDLDVKYGHSDLFLEILSQVTTLSQERASRILDFGHQLVEHIWLWTDQIEKYYDFGTNSVPRRQFDPFLD